MANNVKNAKLLVAGPCASMSPSSVSNLLATSMHNMYSLRWCTILIFILLGSLFGCTTSPSLAMRIEDSTAQTKILIGQFIGSVALLQGSPKTAEITATDGALSCTGKSNTGQFSTDMRMNRITHLFNLSCTNGVTGQLVLNINASSYTINGIGAGTLSDGSKIKVIVGDLAGTLNW